jgi:PAS domain S-box-containing protein
MNTPASSAPGVPGAPYADAPDEVMSATADAAAVHDPLDEILRQIVDGYFVLTDGQGSVSKWSEPAELLFGLPAQEVLGQSFFDTLTDGSLNPPAQSWRAFLENAEAPDAPGRVSVTARHTDGHAFPMEAVFVPVKLDEGFDFSLFLEDLGFELPMNLMLMRMRQQHPVVVRALRGAVEELPQPWEGWRTAGTLVVFRPLAPTPWIEDELAAREAERATADAAVEERIVNPDPGISGNSVADLDDAAAVVARLLSAMERIDDLERMATSVPAQLDEARREAEARAGAAEREAQRLREELQQQLRQQLADFRPETAGPDLETLSRIERLERSRLDEEQSAQDQRRALQAAEAARAELIARLDRVEADHVAAAATATAASRRRSPRRGSAPSRRSPTPAASPRRPATPSRRALPSSARAPRRAPRPARPRSPSSSSASAPSTPRPPSPSAPSSRRPSSGCSASATARPSRPAGSSPPRWSASSTSSARPTACASS